ncbi:MAG: hypothetical protein V4629_10415 [Pseudomonadota bacterium]
MKTSLSISAFLGFSTLQTQGFVTPLTRALQPIRSSASSFISINPSLKNPTTARILQFVKPLDESADPSDALQFLPRLKHNKIAHWFLTLFDAPNSTPLTKTDVLAVQAFLLGTKIQSDNKKNLDRPLWMQALITEPSWKHASFQEQIKMLLQQHITIHNDIRIDELNQDLASFNQKLKNTKQQISAMNERKKNLEDQQNGLTAQTDIDAFSNQLDALNDELEPLLQQKDEFVQTLRIIRMDLNSRQSIYASAPISDALVTTVVGDIKYHVLDRVLSDPKAQGLFFKNIGLKIARAEIKALEIKLHEERAQFVYSNQAVTLEDAFHRILLSDSLLQTYGYLPKIKNKDSIEAYIKIAAADQELPTRKQSIIHTTPVRLKTMPFYSWFCSFPLFVRVGINEMLGTDLLGMSTDKKDNKSVLMVFDSNHPNVASFLKAAISNSPAVLAKQMQGYFQTSLDMFKNFENDDLWDRYPQLFQTVSFKTTAGWAENIYKNTLAQNHPHLLKDYHYYTQELAAELDAHFPYPDTVENIEDLYPVHQQRLAHLSNIPHIDKAFGTFLVGMSAILHIRCRLALEGLEDKAVQELFFKAMQAYNKVKENELNKDIPIIDTFEEFAYFPDSTVVNESLLETLLARWYCSLATGANEYFRPGGITSPRSENLIGIAEHTRVFTELDTIDNIHHKGGLLIVTTRGQSIPTQQETNAFLCQHIESYLRFVFPDFFR